MMNLAAKYSNPLLARETLDELVRSGYRPYLCGDTGYGVVIAWAKTVYVESGEGMVPDVTASLRRVSKAVDCTDVKRTTITRSLEALISSSVRVLVDDFGNLIVKPLLEPVEKHPLTT